MKKCSKCKIEKPLDEFSKDKSRKDGLRARCRSCCSSAFKQYRGANKDRLDAASNAWKRENADRKRNTDKAYREQHAEQHRASASSWAKANRTARNAIMHRRRARIAAAVPQRWRKSETPESLCYWCGCDLAETVTHIEHLMPISLGGPAEAYNEAPACEACNLAKSDTHPLVWLARQF